MNHQYHLLVDSFPAVSETFILRQAMALQMDVVAGKRLEEPLSQSTFPGRVYQVGDVRYGFGSSPARRLLYRLVPSQRTFLPTSASLSEMERIWRAHRPAAVLAAFGTNGIRAHHVCSRLNIPYVIHFHGYDASSLTRLAAYRREIAPALAESIAAVCVSSPMIAAVRQLGATQDKLHLIPYGVNVEQFQPSSRVADEECRFVMVGRLVEKKSPLTSLRAFHACRQQCSHVKLVIIGSGPLHAAVEQEIRRLGIGQDVQLLGACPTDRVVEQLQQSSCFLQHSVTGRDGNMEGWPNAVAEAMASSLPVVATNHAGIVDQVDHGVTGFRVNEHDVQAMANHMITLAMSPELRLQMGMAGRKRMETVGNSQDTLAKLQAVMEQAASSGHLTDSSALRS